MRSRLLCVVTGLCLLAPALAPCQTSAPAEIGVMSIEGETQPAPQKRTRVAKSTATTATTPRPDRRIARPRPVQSPSVRRRSTTKRPTERSESTPVRVTRQGRNLTYHYRHPDVLVAGRKMQGGSRPVEIRGQVYVPLRDFTSHINRAWGLGLDVDWRAGQALVTRRPSAESSGLPAHAQAFGAGLMHMWYGRLADARTSFIAAAAKGHHPDARALADWLGEWDLQTTGVIRIVWMTETPQVAVYVDGQRVLPGTLFVLVKAGRRQIELEVAGKRLDPQQANVIVGKVYRVVVGDGKGTQG